MEPITITPQDVSGKMFLSWQVATGKYGPHKFTITQPVGSTSIIIETEGHRIMLSVDGAIEEVLAQLYGKEETA